MRAMYMGAVLIIVFIIRSSAVLVSSLDTPRLGVGHRSSRALAMGRESMMCTGCLEESGYWIVMAGRV